MHCVKLIFNAVNFVGYLFWGFSVLTFFEQILNDNFNFKNINSFLSAMAAIVALIFAIFKLLAYVRDSKIKSKLLEQELISKQNENELGKVDFYKKWNHEFQEHMHDNNKI